MIMDTHLATTEEARRPEIWTAIRQTKLAGRAQELVLSNGLVSWEDVKESFKHNFRPVINIMGLTNRIFYLKVSSIVDLINTVEHLVAEINTAALYENDSDSFRKLQYHTIIVKI